MRKNINQIYFTIAASSALIYFLLIIFYTDNIPYWDGYHTLDFIYNYNNASSFDQIRDLFFAQHNEHRIVTFRAIGLIAFKLLGTINILPLVYIGYLNLLAIVYLFYTQKSIESSPLIIPIALLVLLPHHLVINWGMTSFSFSFILLCATTCSLLLKNPSWTKVIISQILLLLSSFTMAHGLFVFFVGLISLLLSSNKKYLIVWLMGSTLVFIYYFLGYTKPSHNPISLKFLFSDIFFKIRFFFTTYSSVFQIIYNTKSIILPVTGIFSLYAQIFCFWKMRKSNPDLVKFLIPIWVFLIVTIASSVVSRSGWGITAAFEDRYVLNSAVLLVILLISYYSTYKGRLTLIIVLLLPFIIYISNLETVIPKIKEHQQTIRQGMTKFYFTKEVEGLQMAGHPQVAEYHLNRSFSKNEYSPPLTSISDKIDISFCDFENIKDSRTINFAFKNITLKSPNMIYLNGGWLISTNYSSYETEKYLILQNKLKSQNVYKIKLIESHKRPDVTRHFNNGLNYDDSGVQGYFHLKTVNSKIKNGRYRIGFGIKHKGILYYKLHDHEEIVINSSSI